jgi:hypothetical protein
MAEQRPHEAIWLWVAGAWLIIGGLFVGGYDSRATRFDVVAPLMLSGYACGVLVCICVAGAIRGWRFPFTEGIPPQNSPAGPAEAPAPLIDPVSQTQARIERHNREILAKETPEPRDTFKVTDKHGTTYEAPLSPGNIYSASAIAPSGELESIARWEVISKKEPPTRANRWWRRHGGPKG